MSTFLLALLSMFTSAPLRNSSRRGPHLSAQNFGLLSRLLHSSILCCVPLTGDLGFIGSWFDHAVMMSSSSTFSVFHCLPRSCTPDIQQTNDNMGRVSLAAIVFTLRCASVYAFSFSSQLLGVEPHFIDSVLLFSLTTSLLMKSRDDTVPKRVALLSEVVQTPKTPSWKISILRAYSFYQFLALGSHHPREMQHRMLGSTP